MFFGRGAIKEMSIKDVNKRDGLWAVIGAGPAGIAVVGKLLDAGIDPKEILWIDPDFKVGDLGQKWRSVSSNTKVKLFLDFLNACSSFRYQECPINFQLNHLPKEENCFLHAIADPLEWVSNHLQQRVRPFKTFAEELKAENGQWEITTRDGKFLAKNVVLAIGAEPSTLSLPGPTLLPIEQTVDLDLLKKVCSKNDTVAVFGSSHTAIVALYNLAAIEAKVFNFYRSPLKYAVYLDDWILFDDSGLKGYSAQWARAHLDRQKLPNLERMLVTDSSFNEAFAKCNKVVYAIGFERRKSPLVLPYNTIKYNEHTGIIAPGLFGFGIAFPQGKFDKVGNYEYKVGLWKFMSYLTDVLPIWLKYSAGEATPSKEVLKQPLAMAKTG